MYLFMAKIRLQTRYTLLCYIIQFTASWFKCHIENSNLRSGNRCKKTSARKILRKPIIWCTDRKVNEMDSKDEKDGFMSVQEDEELPFE